MHDKLFLPGLVELRWLVDGGFFGRVLSVRCEFGYWVFEGDWQPAQRPSWNYRADAAVAGLRNCRVQHRSMTPRPEWNPDLPVTESFRRQWAEVPDNGEIDNAFKAQWERFLRSVVGDGEHPYDFHSGARGLRLAEAALRSSTAGRRSELAEANR